MKDYEITKIWACEIAQVSTEIDMQIDYYEREIDRYKENDDSDYAKKRIEMIKESIKCRQWILSIVNAPFKIEK